MNMRYSRLSRWPIYYAMSRLLFSRHPLPPGPWCQLDQKEKIDRLFLLKQSAIHGPIFKAISGNECCICILGLARATRFLQENRDRLRPITIQVAHLFPRGFLRQMQGPDHQHYRKLLVRALREENPLRLGEELESIVAGRLAEFAQQQQQGACTPETLIAALSDISTDLLIRIFYGARPGSDRWARIRSGYRKLGPHGLVWNPGPPQESAFQELREGLRAELLSPREPMDGLAQRLFAQGALDDTMLGNLIYMVEMGRYDTHSLFRWLCHYASDNQAWLERITADDSPETARAFVLETLRMDQSERLLRKVEHDLVFDGFLIPQHATVRLCLWESHKDEQAFPDPFRFHPERFLGTAPTGDQFSPFGLDHHHCPMAEIATALSTVFMRVLARTYVVTAVADGKPARGAYHWEPAATFTVQLTPREPAHHVVG